jgi:hypothetical protein
MRRFGSAAATMAYVCSPIWSICQDAEIARGVDLNPELWRQSGLL